MTIPQGTHEMALEVVASNIILSEERSKVDAVLKFETIRTSLRLKYGLRDRLEIGLEIPLLYREGGYLDPFISSIENAFRAVNPNRITFREGTFGGYLIKLDGKEILSGEDHRWGLGDIVLSAKYLILEEGSKRPAVGIRGAVKLPTGNFDQAFGSGKPDLGMGLVIQKGLGRRWIFYLNQSLIFPIGTFGRTDLKLNSTYAAALDVEYLWTSRISIEGQYNYYTSPFHGTGNHVLDSGASEVVLGLNYKWGPHLWRLYTIENFANPKGAAADFTLATEVIFHF